MSSYNDNLHATVIASLQDQETEQKNLKAEKDASMFTLYYAEGARITATENLNADQAKFEKKEEVKSEAVMDSNISVNVLSSANQVKTEVDQSITNSAVAASNVELATNAIVKLASNVGSIYNIVDAANHGSDIYNLADIANDRIGVTAYLAEQASQHAMMASMYSAEISSTTVAEKAAKTDASITSVLEVASVEYDAISAIVDTDNDALAQSNVIEQKAEGDLENTSERYIATKDAYKLSNKELNLDLKVSVLSSEEFEVTFDLYKAPFQPPLSLNNKTDDESDFPYPVKNYYIMLVKDDMKSTFNISLAEGVLLDSNRYIPVDRDDIIGDSEVEKKIKIFGTKDKPLLDVNGEKFELGDEYVIFVMALFKDEYKKLINNYADYLSAPSSTFSLANELTKAKDLKIVDGENSTQKLTFTITENEGYHVEYRCMFLPYNRALTEGLLTQQGFEKQTDYCSMLKMGVTVNEDEISSLQSKIVSRKAELNALKRSRSEGAETVNDVSNDDLEEKKMKKGGTSREKDLQKVIAGYEKTLLELKGGKPTVKGKEENVPEKLDKCGFIFNLTIAEQVPAGNFEKSHLDGDPTTVGDYIVETRYVDLKSETTDNFGNRLVDNEQYIPVVLSFSTADENDKKQFINALTDFNNTDPFPYKAKEETREGIIREVIQDIERDFGEGKE